MEPHIQHVDRTPSWSPVTSSSDKNDGNSSLEMAIDTPTTSPSSTVTTPSPKDLGPQSPWHWDEARCFLQDLSNFLSLGCLTSFSSISDDEDAPLWSEIFHLPQLTDVCETTQNSVRKLCAAGWIRVFTHAKQQHSDVGIFRIYLLPGDKGNRFIDRSSKTLHSALESVVRNLDISPKTWRGNYTPGQKQQFDMWASSDPDSLFYMFNSLPSPAPCADNIKTHHNRQALEDLLDRDRLCPGLKTPLYPYQRRSAGLMLQRESESRLRLDPRLEKRIAPDESEYFYSARDLLFLRQPRMYEAGKSGILAETMGLGKTLMCLALILSTRGHLPRTPEPYNHAKIRPSVGSLVDMTVSSVNRHSVPWKAFFDAHEKYTGEEMSQCIDRLTASPPSYEIPQEPRRWNRTTTTPPPKRLTLASTTIIVVPRNLCSQWQSELSKHVEEGVLSVLVMDDNKEELPPPDELRQYDVVLFSRTRFELENRNGSDRQGRKITGREQLSCRCPYIGATRTRDCTCLRSDDLYDSPLKHLHFLRLVIDEGHFFSNSNTTAAKVASELVEADHRWVVSGTPAKDLLGVEMDLYSSDAVPMALNDEQQRSSILDQRKSFSTKDDTTGAIKSIGALASQFLRVRPWATGEGERPAAWEDYVYRHEDTKKTFSGFSTCLRQTLEALVVKTRPEDVERDIDLPPLTHNIIRLKPSLYDKITANLFTFVLTANAVTSERTDADYLFHRNSAKARYQLIHNLRQSAFFWTGFSEADIIAAKEHGESYLEKGDNMCKDEDRVLLEECIKQARKVGQYLGWKALSRTHEMGIFVDNWPDGSAVHWSFQGTGPMLVGATQLIQAQSHVNDRCMLDDPSEGLHGAGIKALAASCVDDRALKPQTGDNPMLVKLGIPSSSVKGEPLKKRASIEKPKQKRQSVLPPFQIRKAAKSDTKPRATQEQTFAEPLSDLASSSGGQVSQSQSQSQPVEDELALPLNSNLRKTDIIGTASAKLSYLASQIHRYYQQEKILVFYDGDNVAYYIAQVLELLHVPHLIYAKSLTSAQKSDYVVRFDQEDQFRVLLMDVGQAAYGLNLSSASRVYFVNPVCRPRVEAQAIKRAHRIGQTRPVVVETLILEGTIEEKMFERAKRMSRAEHNDAKVLEDDGGIRDIIQAARPLPISKNEKKGYRKVAYLEEPQQLWTRPGWANWNPGKKWSSVTSPVRTKNQESPPVSKERQESSSAGKKRRRSKKEAAVDTTSGAVLDTESAEPRPAKKLKISFAGTRLPS